MDVTASLCVYSVSRNSLNFVQHSVSISKSDYRPSDFINKVGKLTVWIEYQMPGAGTGSNFKSFRGTFCEEFLFVIGIGIRVDIEFMYLIGT